MNATLEKKFVKYKKGAQPRARMKPLKLLHIFIIQYVFTNTFNGHEVDVTAEEVTLLLLGSI